jgi:hypothetical protein
MMEAVMINNSSAGFGRFVRCFRIAIVALVMLAAAPMAAWAAGKSFDSPEAAMNAFGDAVATSDDEALAAVLGAQFVKLIPPLGDDVRLRFLAAWAKGREVVPDGEGRARVSVGKAGWTLPIPLVKDARGWHFDGKAGREEIRVRAIGRNEHAAINVVLALFDAQREYAEQDRDRDGVREYAARLLSSPGKRDGLYWPTKAGEAPSPIGPLIGEAQAAGAKVGGGYHGYRYRVLTGQGPNAAGGAYDYMVRGNLVGGFGIVAWPVTYGETGVMTFVVNHDGVVYESNLGARTAAAATAMKLFDPGPSWTKVKVEH